MEKTKKGLAKTEKQLAEEFFKEYEKLCEKHGYKIVVNPAWVARDDGTWSTKLQTSVELLSGEK